MMSWRHSNSSQEFLEPGKLIQGFLCVEKFGKGCLTSFNINGRIAHHKKTQRCQHFSRVQISLLLSGPLVCNMLILPTLYTCTKNILLSPATPFISPDEGGVSEPPKHGLENPSICSSNPSVLWWCVSPMRF